MSGRLACVTGATGYVGSRLVDRLLAEGWRVRVMVRDPEYRKEGVEVRIADLSRADLMDGIFGGADVLYHCAALTGDKLPPLDDSYDRINRVGTEYVARSARAVQVRRLIYMSGLGTRPAQPGTYMATRWRAEEAVRAAGVPFVILQPSVLFGGEAAFVRELGALIKQYPVFPAIRGSKLHFQPLWVEDLVTCLVKAADSETVVNQSLPLGGAEILSMPEVARAIGSVLGKKPVVVPVPLWVADIQARLMDRYMRKPPLTRAAVELFSFDNTTTLDAVEKAFGFQPRGFTEHLRTHGLT